MRSKTQHYSITKFSSFFFSVDDPNMVIFEEFLAIDEVLDEAIQALDEAAAHLLPPLPDQQQTPPVAPQQVPTPQGHAQALPQTCYITLKVNQIVMMKWTKISHGETFKTFHPFSS